MTGQQPEASSSNSLPPTNPFSTSAVRPGALDYRFPADDSCELLVGRLRDHAWWGEVVGPHGSGKSTLLHSLHEPLRNAGRRVAHVTLTSGQRRLPVATGEMAAWDADTQLIVDGIEQLSWWQGRKLKRICRRQGCGLLVTAHVSFGLPTIMTTHPTVERTRQLVSELLPAAAAESVSAEDIADAFARHDGNVREVFFDLYDRYESRARDS